TTPAQIPRTHGPMTDDILTGTDYEMSVNPYDVIGHIYDTYGNPVGGATVTYVINGDDTGPLPSVTTGTDGKYVIGVIYKDEIEIVGVTHPGFTLTTPTQIPRTHGPMTSDISEGTDYEMAVNAYVIYGTVHDLVEEIPLDGVEITYRVNGGSPVTLPLTGAGGTFEISAVYLDAVSVSISKVGFKTDPAGQTMSFGPMIEDEYAEFYMSVLRFNVTIEYTGGGTVTYTLDNGTPVPITCTESGTYVINDVAYGTDIVVTVVPDDRHTSQIEDDRGLSRDSTFFSTELTGDVLLFATFTFIEDSNALIWMSLLLLLALLMIILIILLARTGLTGTVYYEGEGLEGVTVKYVMNGKERTAVTNDKGVYKIRAAVGSEITITDVSKNGYTLDQKMPRDIKYEKGTKGIDLTMSG
ncbi:MAG: carboxypeptidase-like regulatory domain-containing protein, partial [Methanomassiliicoccaceae archaeon]|nr:carboxypeptidase-like regulatory domain-containing protein [Methanomassiliicoccaceae archaeon]